MPSCASAAGRPVGYNGARRSGSQVNFLLPRWSFAGFAYAHEEPFPLVLSDFRVPDWAPLAIFAGVPLVLGVLRRRRRRPGFCRNCGYDLRATPHRCPECGATPSAEPTRTTRFAPVDSDRPPR